MTNKLHRVAAIGAVLLSVAGAGVLAAHGATTQKAADRISFSEFKGYPDWQVVAVSATPARNVIDVIVGNPVAIAAYKAGIPANGKTFPDGAKIAKIHWNAKVSDAPGQATIAGTLHDADFMMKDSKRFSDSGGWGYAPFEYEAATDTFKLGAEDAKCGTACHALAKADDFVFTAFAKR